MGHRLSKIVTRTGDQGETGLGDGSRVAKNSARIEAIGEIDELNSCLGVLLAESLPEEIAQLLIQVQHDLFDLGGELSIPGYISITESQVAQLESWLEKFNAHLPPLKEFILPGGTRAASLAQLSRAICRRAERRVVNLHHSEPVSDYARKYVNRLSDLLFVLSRVINREARRPDTLWQKNRHVHKADQ